MTISTHLALEVSAIYGFAMITPEGVLSPKDICLEPGSIVPYKGSPPSVTRYYQPQEWSCDYCGAAHALTKWKCTQCGGPKR